MARTGFGSRAGGCRWHAAVGRSPGYFARTMHGQPCVVSDEERAAAAPGHQAWGLCQVEHVGHPAAATMVPCNESTAASHCMVAAVVPEVLASQHCMAAAAAVAVMEVVAGSGGSGWCKGAARAPTGRPVACMPRTHALAVHPAIPLCRRAREHHRMRTHARPAVGCVSICACAHALGGLRHSLFVRCGPGSIFSGRSWGNVRAVSDYRLWCCCGARTR